MKSIFAKGSGKALFFVFFMLLFGSQLFGQETRKFEGVWYNITSTSYLMQLYFGNNSVSATALVFSGNKCFVEVLGGLMGMSRSRTWEGTYRVNPENETIDLIDDFGDSERYRYVFSESGDDYILRLKDESNEITTWYMEKKDNPFLIR